MTRKATLRLTIVIFVFTILVAFLGLENITIYRNPNATWFVDYYLKYNLYDFKTSYCFICSILIIMPSILVLAILYKKRIINRGRFYHIFVMALYSFVAFSVLLALLGMRSLSDMGVFVYTVLVILLIFIVCMTMIHFIQSILFEKDNY